MTLTDIEIKGFRSVRKLRLPLRQLTVLIGGNGVGKTNLYRSLELLHAAARGTLADEIARIEEARDDAAAIADDLVDPEHSLEDLEQVQRRIAFPEYGGAGFESFGGLTSEKPGGTLAASDRGESMIVPGRKHKRFGEHR